MNINVTGPEMRSSVELSLARAGVNMDAITMHLFPTNDAWCRDHGPAFVTNPDAQSPKAIVDWEYNGWGGKYPAGLDNLIPSKIGEMMNLPVFHPGIVMEGGAVDFNGRGTVITTTSCLLHPNRNPGLSKLQIEKYLVNFYGVEQVLWLRNGIEGDDTNGHVDDHTRFVNEDTVISMVEHNRADANYVPLKHNLKTLNSFRLISGRQLNVIELPMPEPLYYQGQRLPASYANFYIANSGVMVPVFNCKQDEKALEILSLFFSGRPVIGINSVEIIWGLGSWHCLSQQEPLAVNSDE